MLHFSDEDLELEILALRNTLKLANDYQLAVNALANRRYDHKYTLP